MEFDSTPGTVGPFTFTLPLSQDPNQRVSVVIAMDYSFSVQQQFLTPLQDAVMDFINAMHDGDFAAIVKFSDIGGATVVRPFTQINAAAKVSLGE